MRYDTSIECIVDRERAGVADCGHAWLSLHPVRLGNTSWYRDNHRHSCIIFFLPNGGGYWALVVGIALLAINSMVCALLHISSAIQLRHELVTQNIGRGSVTIIRPAEQRGSVLQAENFAPSNLHVFAARCCRYLSLTISRTCGYQRSDRRVASRSTTRRSSRTNSGSQ